MLHKKKIVLVTPGIGTGGAEKLLSILVRGLRESSFDPLIISLSQVENTDKIPDFDGLPLIHCEFRLGIRLPWSLKNLRSILTKEKPEIIQGWMYAGNIVASIAGIGTASKIYHSIRASNMDNCRYGKQIWLNAKLSNYTEAVIANSHSGSHHHIVKGFCEKKMLTISNGINIENFRPNRTVRNNFRRTLGIKPDEVVFLYVARVDPMKGHGQLIAAARLCPKIKFIFVGHGTEKLNAPDNIIKLGTRRDLSAIYNGVDWLISWSQFGEGFPNVIAEAMACGVPTFANNVGDSWFIIGDTGFKSAACTAEQIAKDIKKLLTKPVTNSEKKRVINRITNNFSAEKMITEYISVYQGSKSRSH